MPRCIIPAGYFATVGKALRIKAAGSIGSTAGTATFVFAAGLDAAAGTIAGTGGATLFTAATLTPATGTSPWDLDGDITCQAVGNLGTTAQFNGTLRVGGTTANAWATTFTMGATGTSVNMLRNNLTGLNNEISLYLELFGTWSVSNAANTTTLEQFKVYGEN